MRSKKLALIVVHGVADQKPGDTARALVELMVSAAPAAAAGATYVASARSDFVLAVEPLAPSLGHPLRDDATPRGEDRDLGKAWRQSLRSDFHVRPPQADADRGIAATDYLLAKHRDNGAAVEAYETACIRLERRQGGSTQEIAVYEMFWADLSRLSGALPRIVTELFTMIFRLSKLGRDTVDEASRADAASSMRSVWSARAWSCVSFLQGRLDWMFANVLALLFAQLLLLGLVLLALGSTALAGERRWLYDALAAVGVFVGGLVVFYHRREAVLGPERWAAGFLVAVACFGALLSAPLAPWVLALLLIGVVTLLYDTALGIADDRFPLVRIAGRTLWAALIALMLASAVHEIASARGNLDPLSLDVGWHATLFGIEVTLWAIKWWWIAAGVMLAAWFASGIVAAWRRGYEVRASIATGRLGLAISMATFLVLTMAVWALLSGVIDRAAQNVIYSPCIFEFDERKAILDEQAYRGGQVAVDDAPRAVTASPRHAPTPNECLWRSEANVTNAIQPPAASASSGARFLKDRYARSTAAFSVVAVLLLVLVLFLVSMFVPSVLAEMKLLVGRARDRAKKNAAQTGAAAAPSSPPSKREVDGDEAGRILRLGRWLTSGFHRLDDVVVIVVGFGVVAGVVVALLFLGSVFSIFSGWPAAGLRALEQHASGLSDDWLKRIVIAIAGVGVTLTALGGVLSRYLPALRAPLDVALDVDNHFREFPRAAIPRARIFSRYAALLRHIAEQGHDRIVIVAHSQGTVITAELLRYLSSDGVHAPRPGSRPFLAGSARRIPRIRLLTLGCPLRQLYAARFPTLYRWVIRRQANGVTGPRAADLGVSRWVNAFCSGDYVGRWLWSDSPDPDDPVGHPMIDSGPSGRPTAYEGFGPPPPEVAPFRTAREIEACLGFGAHTHYFESDQVYVARLVDSLLR